MMKMRMAAGGSTALLLLAGLGSSGAFASDKSLPSLSEAKRNACRGSMQTALDQSQATLEMGKRYKEAGFCPRMLVELGRLEEKNKGLKACDRADFGSDKQTSLVEFRRNQDEMLVNMRQLYRLACTPG